MPMKTHKGNCHCGAVQYEVDIDLSAGTLRCNCSICSKARVVCFRAGRRISIACRRKPAFRLSMDPPGKPRPNLHYRFCRTCGIRIFAAGKDPSGADIRAIAVASLDYVDPDEAAGSINYVDGAHDRYDRPPDDTRLL